MSDLSSKPTGHDSRHMLSDDGDNNVTPIFGSPDKLDKEHTKCKQVSKSLNAQAISFIPPSEAFQTPYRKHHNVHYKSDIVNTGGSSSSSQVHRIPMATTPYMQSMCNNAEELANVDSLPLRSRNGSATSTPQSIFSKKHQNANLFSQSSGRGSMNHNYTQNAQYHASRHRSNSQSERYMTPQLSPSSAYHPIHGGLNLNSSHSNVSTTGGYASGNNSNMNTPVMAAIKHTMQQQKDNHTYDAVSVNQSVPMHHSAHKPQPYYHKQTTPTLILAQAKSDHIMQQNSSMTLHNIVVDAVYEQRSTNFQQEDDTSSVGSSCPSFIPVQLSNIVDFADPQYPKMPNIATSVRAQKAQTPNSLPVNHLPIDPGFHKRLNTKMLELPDAFSVKVGSNSHHRHHVELEEQLLFEHTRHDMDTSPPRTEAPSISNIVKEEECTNQILLDEISTLPTYTYKGLCMVSGLNLTHIPFDGELQRLGKCTSVKEQRTRFDAYGAGNIGISQHTVSEVITYTLADLHYFLTVSPISPLATKTNEFLPKNSLSGVSDTCDMSDTSTHNNQHIQVPSVDNNTCPLPIDYVREYRILSWRVNNLDAIANQVMNAGVAEPVHHAATYIANAAIACPSAVYLSNREIARLSGVQNNDQMNLNTNLQTNTTTYNDEIFVNTQKAQEYKEFLSSIKAIEENQDYVNVHNVMRELHSQDSSTDDSCVYNRVVHSCNENMRQNRRNLGNTRHSSPNADKYEQMINGTRVYTPLFDVESIVKTVSKHNLFMNNIDTYLSTPTFQDANSAYNREMLNAMLKSVQHGSSCYCTQAKVMHAHNNKCVRQLSDDVLNVAAKLLAQHAHILVESLSITWVQQYIEYISKERVEISQLLSAYETKLQNIHAARNNASPTSPLYPQRASNVQVGGMGDNDECDDYELYDSTRMSRIRVDEYNDTTSVKISSEAPLPSITGSPVSTPVFGKQVPSMNNTLQDLTLSSRAPSGSKRKSIGKTMEEKDTHFSIIGLQHLSLTPRMSSPKATYASVTRMLLDLKMEHTVLTHKLNQFFTDLNDIKTQCLVYTVNVLLLTCIKSIFPSSGSEIHPTSLWRASPLNSHSTPEEILNGPLSLIESVPVYPGYAYQMSANLKKQMTDMQQKATQKALYTLPESCKAAPVKVCDGPCGSAYVQSRFSDLLWHTGEEDHTGNSSSRNTNNKEDEENMISLKISKLLTADNKTPNYIHIDPSKVIPDDIKDTHNIIEITLPTPNIYDQIGIGPGTIVALDIDDTIHHNIHHPCMLLTQTGTNIFKIIVHQSQPYCNESYETKQRHLSKLQEVLHSKTLVEYNTADIIYELQSRGCLVIGLTSRYKEMKASTLQSLRDLNIDLSLSSPISHMSIEDAGTDACYENGVIFTNAMDKGIIFDRFIQYFILRNNCLTPSDWSARLPKWNEFINQLGESYNERIVLHTQELYHSVDRLKEIAMNAGIVFDNLSSVSNPGVFVELLCSHPAIINMDPHLTLRSSIRKNNIEIQEHCRNIYKYYKKRSLLKPLTVESFPTMPSAVLFVDDRELNTACVQHGLKFCQKLNIPVRSYYYNYINSTMIQDQIYQLSSPQHISNASALSTHAQNITQQYPRLFQNIQDPYRLLKTVNLEYPRWVTFIPKVFACYGSGLTSGVNVVISDSILGALPMHQDKDVHNNQMTQVLSGEMQWLHDILIKTISKETSASLHTLAPLVWMISSMKTIMTQFSINISQIQELPVANNDQRCEMVLRAQILHFLQKNGSVLNNLDTLRALRRIAEQQQQQQQQRA